MSETAEKEPRAASGTAWAALLTLVLAYALALVRSEPPPVVERDGPRDAFQGERALAQLARIQGAGRPHPIGSLENTRVRAEIVAAFAALGVTAEVDERLAIGRNRVVALTRNIVARLPGRASTKSVLVCAHHDSVPAGPGTSDDGAGVAAALEIARVLVNDADRKNDVVFLIDDGEEAGLIGASAFLAHHPLARDVGVVVNLEARGTNGRAHMFETSADNRSLIAALARGVPHPSATSVAYELYKKMPNDTDVTVFKEAGLVAMNFAFIGGLARYHTPLDDVAHLDPRSLQHIGESALGIVNELVDEDLTQLADGDAVYADVLGFTLIHFPVRAMLPLAVLALMLFLWSAWRADGERFIRDLVAVCLGFVAAVGAAFAIVWCLTAARSAAFPWSAHPQWTRIAVLLGALACGSWIARLVSRNRAGSTSTRQAAYGVYALIGVAAAIVMPSASYLFVFPTLAAAVVALIAPRAERVSVFLPLVIAALFTLPVMIGVEEGFGYGAPVGAIVGLFVVLAAPAFVAGTVGPLAVAGGLAALAWVAALCVPCFDADSPAWLNIVHDQNASGEARWIAVPIAAPMPVELEQAAAFEPRDNAFADRFWSGARAGFVAPAAASHADAPRVELIGAGEPPIVRGARVVRARLWSPRGAVRFVVRAPQEVQLLSITRGTDTIVSDFESSSSDHAQSFKGFDGRGLLRLTGIDAAGVVLELRIDAVEPVEFEIADISSDMPSAFAALSRARPAHYVPRGEGNVSVIQARVRL